MPDPVIVRVTESAGIPRRGDPVTVGVPLAEGLVQHEESLSLRGADGEEIPVQVRALERWPRGGLRWALLDFALDVPPHGSVDLEVVPQPRSAAPRHTMQARASADGIFVDTGAAQFAVDRAAFLPLRSARVGGVELLDPDRCGWGVRTETGPEGAPRVTSLELETQGAIRSVVRVRGPLASPGQTTFLDFDARMHFHAGSPSVRLVLTVRNPRRARHPGGHWELGDPGSFLFRDLSLRVAAARGNRVSWSPVPGAPLGETSVPTLELYQDSSGGENWQSPVHLARGGASAVSFHGYRVRSGGTERVGARATPRAVVHDGDAGVSASMQYFWQNFPKAIEAADGVLTVRLFPQQSALPHELQGGEQRTHQIWLTFGPEALAEGPDGQRAPLLASPTPATFVSSGAIPYLTEQDPALDGDHLRLVSAAIEGEDSFSAKRERIDEYGWRNFGDVWADHEGFYDASGKPFVSHFNNQYDVVWGAFLQHARSGDPRWREMQEEMAAHVADIDVYHTDRDRPAYNHGLFWHTAHYVRAGLSTHRSYPSGDTIGGGPSNEHNYAAGLVHTHLLTGDEQFREAALERARWVVQGDEGMRTVLRWIHRGPTGLASATRDPAFHGPGRGAGNSLQVLLDVWRLTAEEQWLGKAEELLHRTSHPLDDPAGHDLLDSETRWSYTAYLQALGRFLDEMAAAGRLGEPYAYARATLLAYARWMAEHERPALDAPERLEHPTETWAAQDLRKGEVFRFAALHSSGEERTRFEERARYFHRASLETLQRFETGTYTRPLSLLMRYGLMESWFAVHPRDARPAPEHSGPFPPPVHFVPQRAAAIARLVRAGALAGAGLVLGIALRFLL